MANSLAKMPWRLKSIFKRKILLGGGNSNESLSNFNTKFNLPNSEAKSWESALTVWGKSRALLGSDLEYLVLALGRWVGTGRYPGKHQVNDITVLTEKWKEARDKHNALDSSAEEAVLLSRCV